MRQLFRQSIFSALARHRLLLGVVVLVTLIQITVSLWGIQAVQQQVVHSVSAIVQSRVAQLENNFASLSGNLKRRLVTQTQLSLFEQALSENTLERIQARHQLIDNLFYITGTSTSDHLLFYYLADSDEFLTGVHSNYIPFSQQNAIFNEIRRRIADGYQPASNSSRWILLQADERYYALLLYRYQNMWVGGCIPADILIQPLNDIYLDGQSIPVLFTAEGELAAGGNALTAAGLLSENALRYHGTFWQDGKRWLAVEPVISDEGFQIKLFLKGYGQFETILFLQAGVLFLVALMMGIVILTMSYTQKRILRPLRLFTERLKTFDPQKLLLLDTETQIFELAAANEQFNNLIREIKRLRIGAYEQELKIQKTQMDYMQLQIKPHFFLNSLNLIHTMAQKGDTGGIALLSESTAKYLRYIFQSDAATLPLTQELEHIRDYLSIMQLRYPERFSCEIVSEPDAEVQALPPLILQTFVENAVKHGMRPDTRLEITLSALCEDIPGTDGSKKAFLTIFITDNGYGFPASFLSEWAAGRQLERTGGQHIGIANAAQRLQLAYGDRAKLLLYNSPLGGAVVELHIPCISQEEAVP